MLIGYARVSTTGQNLESQIEHLQAVGCDKIYQEKLTGFDRRRFAGHLLQRRQQ